MSYEDKAPQAIREEELILGAILVSDWDGINQILDFALGRNEPLSARDFYRPLHRYWYESFLKLHNEGSPVNLATAGQFCDEKHLRANLISFVDGVEHSTLAPDRRTISELIDLVQEKRKRRDLITKYQAQSAYLYDPLTSTDEAIAKLQTSVAALEENCQEKSGLLHISESLADTFNQLEDRMNGLVEPYLKTGWKEFDHRFGGIPDGMTIFMGRPAMGKTAAALTVALNAAIRHQSVLIFSLEMDAKKLNNRFLAMITGIAGTRIKKGELYDGEIAKIIEAVAFLSELNIYIMDRPSSVEGVLQGVTKWGRKHNRKPDLVIVDYLQLLVSGDGNSNNVAEVSYISRQLQMLSNFFKVRPNDGKTESFPLIAVSQLSRSVESRTNKRPVMSDIRESGQIEQDAEFIVGFYRDEYYNPHSPDIGIAEAIAVKNRDGQCGTTKLLFQAETTRFHDLVEIE